MAEPLQHHIMIFEPRLEGHHLSWLRYVTEDFLGAGFKLTWAVDYRPEARRQIQEQLSTLIPHVSVISVFNEAGKLRGGNKIRAIAECLRESSAQDVFLNSLDEIASNCLRAAALGIYPPRILRGRLSGVYLRPRFLTNSIRPLGNIIKTIGFRRLCRHGWFKCIYLMDEDLFPTFDKSYYDTMFYFLPDPWAGDFSHQQNETRKALGIPLDRFVFLCYGIGDRRKGLHLVIRAMLDLPSESRLFLLCAGRVAKDRDVIRGLQQLKGRNLAQVMNRYVSNTEEALCFCASDVVLLPYIKHFGSSGVLSRAAASGTMVIASDEGLVARRVREHNLGWLFPSGNVNALRKTMDEAAFLAESDKAQFRESALKYARLCSRKAFKKALLVPCESSQNRFQSVQNGSYGHI